MEAFIYYSKQKQNLLVCREWYEYFMVAKWTLRDPEYIDWIPMGWTVIYTGDYNNFKYRISELMDRGISIGMKTMSVPMDTMKFHMLEIDNMDGISIDERKFNCKTLSVNSRKKKYNVYEDGKHNVLISKSQIKCDELVIMGLKSKIKKCTIDSQIMKTESIRCDKYSSKFTIKSTTINTKELYIKAETVAIDGSTINAEYMEVDLTTTSWCKYLAILGGSTINVGTLRIIGRGTVHFYDINYIYMNVLISDTEEETNPEYFGSTKIKGAKIEYAV